jgi:hypothetical protein
MNKVHVKYIVSHENSVMKLRILEFAVATASKEKQIESVHQSIKRLEI